MKIGLLDPRNGYKPFTDRTQAREHLESLAGRERVVLEFTSSGNLKRISTEVHNADALVGGSIPVDYIGIGPGRGADLLSINQHSITD